MENSDRQVFIRLFREACLKCFGHELTSSLSEAESKQMSTRIFDATGLVIGVKSIKNYSQFVTGTDREENPSVATLDTLARFVMGAPVIDETIRKDNESHYPYWFEYKKNNYRPTHRARLSPRTSKRSVLFILIVLVAAAAVYFITHRSPKPITEDFNSVDEDVLISHGWRVIAKEKSRWEKRSEKEGHITLYTLKGDNWSDASNHAMINNLLVREIDATCFSIEVHFTDFMPEHNWQQAGLLLMEDTLMSSKGIRLSLAYNDFFGGYDQSPEILVQAISSMESGGFNKPEEFAHIPLFKLDSAQKSLAKHNLSNSALRIEKSGPTFRFLYSTGAMQNAAFKEAAVRDFKFAPKYVAVFAIHGFVDNTDAKPVYVDKFTLSPQECR